MVLKIWFPSSKKSKQKYLKYLDRLILTCRTCDTLHMFSTVFCMLCMLTCGNQWHCRSIHSEKNSFITLKQSKPGLYAEWCKLENNIFCSLMGTVQKSFF